MYTRQDKCIPLKVQSQECLQSEEEHNDCECYHTHTSPLTSTPTRDHLSEDTFAVFVLSEKLRATFLIGCTLTCSSVLFEFPTVDSFYSRRRASEMTHKTTADLVLNQDVAPSEAFALY